MLPMNKALILVAVIAIVTFFTRILPFVIFPGNKKTPAFVDYLGKVLPYAVMGMLVVYCLKSINILITPHGIPEVIGVAAVIILHKVKHNLLLSIAGGTILYMLLVQCIFS